MIDGQMQWSKDCLICFLPEFFLLPNKRSSMPKKLSVIVMCGGVFGSVVLTDYIVKTLSRLIIWHFSYIKYFGRFIQNKITESGND